MAHNGEGKASVKCNITASKDVIWLAEQNLKILSTILSLLIIMPSSP